MMTVITIIIAIMTTINYTLEYCLNSESLTPVSSAGTSGGGVVLEKIVRTRGVCVSVKKAINTVEMRVIFFQVVSHSV